MYLLFTISHTVSMIIFFICIHGPLSNYQLIRLWFCTRVICTSIFHLIFSHLCRSFNKHHQIYSFQSIFQFTVKWNMFGEYIVVSKSNIPACKHLVTIKNIIKSRYTTMIPKNMDCKHTLRTCSNSQLVID